MKITQTKISVKAVCENDIKLLKWNIMKTNNQLVIWISAIYNVLC